MKNILFCTIDSWNQNIGASSTNTYATLFSDYPSENLAGLYLREEFPDNDRCCIYYQISEQKIIKSILNRSIKTGQILTSNSMPTNSDIDDLRKTYKLYSKNRNKRKYYKLFARELIWKFGRWKTDELDNFLECFKPDIIIFSMEGYIHFHRICRYIIKRTGAYPIGYVWDDTFTYKQVPGSVCFKMFRFFQRRSIRKSAKICKEFWAITPKTKKEFDNFAGVNCKIVTKPLNEYHANEISPFLNKRVIKLLYTGNLAIGRIDTLKCLSNAIDRINIVDKKIILDVYTNTLLTEDDKKFFSKYIIFHKPVPAWQVASLLNKADVLLFIEDIVGNNSMKARLSFSTKLTDYFSAAKCIFAIGPADIAPMEYLKTEDAALCVNNKSQIESSLKHLVDEPSLIDKYAQKALICGQRYHSKEKILEIVNSSIKNITT